MYYIIILKVREKNKHKDYVNPILEELSKIAVENKTPSFPSPFCGYSNPYNEGLISIFALHTNIKSSEIYNILTKEIVEDEKDGLIVAEINTQNVEAYCNVGFLLATDLFWAK